MKKEISFRKKLIIMAMLVAGGVILQYVESRILITPIPGGKLGLANVVSIVNIFLFGGKNAIVISVLRAFLGTFISSGVTALPYSIFGAFFSTLLMSIMICSLYPKISCIGVSIVGASTHNIVQISIAALTFSSTYIFSYLSLLLLVSVVSGTITGYCAQIFLNRITKGDKI